MYLHVFHTLSSCFSMIFDNRCCFKLRLEEWSASFCTHRFELFRAEEKSPWRLEIGWRVKKCEMDWNGWMVNWYEILAVNFRMLLLELYLIKQDVSFQAIFAMHTGALESLSIPSMTRPKTTCLPSSLGSALVPTFAEGCRWVAVEKSTLQDGNDDIACVDIASRWHIVLYINLIHVY